MAIHHVDMLRMITGREVTEVDARGWRAPDSPFKHDPTVEARASVSDNLRSLGLILAIARSTEERRPVRVTEVLAG